MPTFDMIFYLFFVELLLKAVLHQTEITG